MYNYFKIARKCIRYLLSFEKTDVSYYPEKERKSKSRIIIENVLYLFKHGTIMKDYYSYGFDVKGVDIKDFFDADEFMSKRNKTNGIFSKKLDYTCLIGNKELFELVCKTHNLRAAISLGVYCGNGYYIDSFSHVKKELKELLINHPHLFLKPNASAKGKSAFVIDIEYNGLVINGLLKDYEKAIEELDNVGMEMLIQDKLVQHNVINKIYPHSLNTIRMVSVLEGNEVIIVGALLRCGAEGRVVDNASQGGVFIGIKSDGTLDKYGFYYPEFGTKTEIHPDTKILFDSIEIPYYDDVVNLVREAHKVFKWIKTIGWDIAVLEDGPILIEGNSRYAERIMQICCGGMKNKMNKYLTN